MDYKELTKLLNKRKKHLPFAIADKGQVLAPEHLDGNLCYMTEITTMILLTLIISSKEQLETITDIILQHKYATNVVVSNPEQAFYLNSEGMREKTVVYKLQFATKALLFSEIETLLARELPQKEFYMYATPIVQTTNRFFDRLRSSIKALNIMPGKKSIGNGV